MAGIFAVPVEGMCRSITAPEERRQTGQKKAADPQIDGRLLDNRFFVY
jgi:hypothetical protein